jgi:superfamily I DNA/RNA helicase
MSASATRPQQLSSLQETLVHLPTQGRFLVRGAAGSGKTAVAIGRALRLARQPLVHGGARVLLITREGECERAAARAVAERAPELRGRVEACSIQTWCRARAPGAPRSLGSAQSESLVEAARRLVARRSRSLVLKRPLTFFAREIESMLLALGVERFEEYAELAREGRRTALEDDARRAVFAVFEEFLALCDALGVAPPLRLVNEALRKASAERAPPYDHVVVDDAHALAPVELKLARALAAGGSLTLFSPLEQPFDPLAARLRDLGLARLDRAEALPRVQRGPAPIFAAAKEVARRCRSAVAADLAQVDSGSIEGEKPRLIEREGERGELEALGEAVAAALAGGRAPDDVAVLALDEVRLELARTTLARRGIGSTRGLDDGVRLRTIAETAGLEFASVFVLDVNRGAFPPDRREAAPHEAVDRDDEARRALHLAMTRATARLTLLATKDTRSRLLPAKLLRAT